MPRRGGKGKNEKNVSAWSMGNSSIVCNYSHIPKQPPSFLLRSGRESSHLLLAGWGHTKCAEEGREKKRPYREDQFTLIWTDEEKKNHNSITVLLKKKISKAALLNWTVLAFIQR